MKSQIRRPKISGKIVKTTNGSQFIQRDELRVTAIKPHSASPRPFLRWAGSKRLILSQFIEFLPAKFGVFHEPFLGSGAMFFLIRPERGIISDGCRELINCYQAIRDNVSAVLRYLSPLKPDKELFYQIRDNRSSGKFQRAAEFIYLNKTCWNGLYRVNSEGKFNVPYGRPKTDTIVDVDNLKNCSRLLNTKGIFLSHNDYSLTLDRAERGDFVYFDPPYVTGHRNNGFRDYNENLFSWEDQERLAEIARKLVGKGVKVLVSNAWHSDINKLYSDFSVYTFNRKSTIASQVHRRGETTEAIYYS